MNDVGQPFISAPQSGDEIELITLEQSREAIVAALEELRPTSFPDPIEDNMAEWDIWGKHYVAKLEAAIKRYQGGSDESNT